MDRAGGVQQGFAWNLFIAAKLWDVRVREEKEAGRTRGEVLIDWPVVHLQGGVTPVPGEAHQVVFAIVDGGAGLLHADVHCPDVEGHAHFALFLEKKKGTTKKNQTIRVSSTIPLVCPPPANHLSGSGETQARNPLLDHCQWNSCVSRICSSRHEGNTEVPLRKAW